jgi:hypothetical protein
VLLLLKKLFAAQTLGGQKKLKQSCEEETHLQKDAVVPYRDQRRKQGNVFFTLFDGIPIPLVALRAIGNPFLGLPCTGGAVKGKV